jgi:hypothetical protein
MQTVADAPVAVPTPMPMPQPAPEEAQPTAEPATATEGQQYIAVIERYDIKFGPAVSQKEIMEKTRTTEKLGSC